MITFSQKGSFDKLDQFLYRSMHIGKLAKLDRYGQEGVTALKNATPVDTGNTRDCWDYEVKNENGTCSISFFNTNINDGVPIAIILQYGHGTRNGGYVRGRDYINPAIRPIFDRIAENVWKEVCNG